MGGRYSGARIRAAAIVFLCLAALLITTGCGERKAQPHRPNILFVLSDEHRFDALGCYGNRVVRTPHLDALAAQGVRFDRFYVAAPLCSPSRASFLSGLYPHQSGVMDNNERAEFPKPTPTVASLLRDAGYHTVFIGKSHMGGDPTRWGFDATPVVLPEGGAFEDSAVLNFNGEARTVHGPVTGVFADEAIRYLEQNGSKGPWFLWFAPRDAHRPYHTGSADLRYDPAAIVPPPGWPPDQPLSDHDWAGYYGSVSYLDEQIGRVLDALDRLGLANDTMVFFAGDNGSMFGSHGEARKQVWYEESVRVPAILRWPGHVPAGSVAAFPAVSVDYLPTALEAAGIRRNDPRIEGMSLLPGLSGRTPVRSRAFSEMDRVERFGGGYWHMVTDDRFKYVRFEEGEQHLYDLVADPHETRDLAALPEQAATIERLGAELSAWQSRYR